MTLTKWMRRAESDEGTTPGQSRTEAAQIRELKKRNRLPEQENEVLRGAPAAYPVAGEPAVKRFYPLVTRASPPQGSRDGDVSGAQALPPALLPVAG